MSTFPDPSAEFPVMQVREIAQKRLEIWASFACSRMADSPLSVMFGHSLDSSRLNGTQAAASAVVSALMGSAGHSGSHTRYRELPRFFGNEAGRQLDHAGACPQANLRKEAATALGEIADPKAKPYLEAAVNDPDPEVRRNVRWALQQIERSKNIVRLRPSIAPAPPQPASRM